MTVDLFTSAPPCTPPCYPALPAWLGRPDVAAGGSLNPDKLAVAVKSSGVALTPELGRDLAEALW